MDSTERARVIVGVTGPGRETGALRYALECARREDAEVVLVHAFRMAMQPPPPSVLMANDSWRDVASWVVKEVAEELEDLSGGDVPCRTVVRAGSPSQVIVELSRGARLVVLQHRDAGLLGRIFVGSTVNAAAAHAHCPVVSVPEGWTPAREAADAPTDVVVGVHEGGTPREALAAGLAEAAATGARLRVVHAWRLDTAYDDIITARVAEDWRIEQELALREVVEGLREEHPDVRVHVEVRHQWPAQVLVDLSETAGLVVVGRHGAHGWLPGHLGSVPRTVLREASSPVMVVPLEGTRHPDEDWELRADEVSPQT
jgi:nucleotide-binding universal stress UspA family protein